MKTRTELLISITWLFLFTMICYLCYLVTIKSPKEMSVEIRDVTVEDLELLIDRAKVSGNLELEAILHAVAGALETGTLAELANYTTKYSRHMLEDHYKSIKKLNTI